MIWHQLRDWSDAYSNGAHIAGGERWPGLWAGPAAGFREMLSAAGRARLGLRYGAHERQQLDLFLPEGQPQGLIVFIHGGYWLSLDNSWWSHYAHGCVAQGFAVAMPAYRLCPEVRITGIGQDIAAAIALAAAEVAGPIAITGHSAGGHLTARMIAAGTPLAAEVLARVRLALPVSGLFDLRPLMRTKMNETLGITEEEALAESPALLRPAADVPVLAWVGGAERQEFRRQNALLANIWTGLGAKVAEWAEPDRHHFDVLEGLSDPAHAMVQALTAIR